MGGLAAICQKYGYLSLSSFICSLYTLESASNSSNGSGKLETAGDVLDSQKAKKTNNIFGKKH